MKLSSSGLNQQQSPEGEKNSLNSELWHACAGPLVSLPAVGSHVVYFPQGHSEQVAVSTNKEVDSQTPNYPSLPPQLICQLHNITMHADIETDEVYAQMTLQPLNQQEQKEVSFVPADMVPNKQPTNYFCKTLTASDTSTHGGFSVPRRAAEKVLPPLDFSLQPPVQELIARDLHNNEWKFRHIFRGQPKRHLLTTGWSIFVSAKRLIAGDSVLFIWNEKNQLLLGIRRAHRPQTCNPSSVLSSDSMHLGLLAAAAHAAATNSRFTIFYNPRTSPSEFVVPLTKYVKAVNHTRVSVGMRFRMMFETEESSVRRYMGTITGISDMDPARWTNSHWRSVKVGWDESTAGDRQPRVSLWEIEPFTTFPMYPSPFSLRLKRPWSTGIPSFNGMKNDDMRFDSNLTWGAAPWMMHQPRFDNSILDMQNEIYQSMALQETRLFDPTKQIFTQFYQPQILHQSNTPQSHTNLTHQQLQQVSNVLPTIQPILHDFSDTNLKPVSSNVTSLLGSDGWSTKRVALDSLLSSENQYYTNATQNPVSLPTFPGRESLIEQEESNGRQNHSNFGVNTDSSSCFLIMNGISNLRGIASECGDGTVGFATADYSLDPTVNSNRCIDELSFRNSAENVELVDTPNRAFVKVYRSGSFGRSLDITKFSNYHELRGELGRMFGLESQLEDPFRSGWQLVFVDRENDVLLLGDDPWPEFVNSVWCIKILSPQEVHDMGKQGMEILSSITNQKMPNGPFDGYVTRQEVGDISSGIPPVGNIEF